MDRVLGKESGKRNLSARFLFKSGIIFTVFIERTEMIAFK